MGKLIEADPLKGRGIGAYRKLTPQIFKEANLLSASLKNLAVIHINSAFWGGGVAELLRSQVPLERSLGIESRWFFYSAPLEFFEVTKKLHNFLHGKSNHLSREEKLLYLKVNQEISRGWGRILEGINPALAGKSGVKGRTIVVIHDQQPLSLVEAIPQGVSKILRLHGDLSTPNPAALVFLRPFIEKFDRVVVTHKSYSPRWLDPQKVRVILPAIDPFSDKNREISYPRAAKTLLDREINIDKPIAAQVARFDPWKDPMGVIRAYYIAKNKIPDLQLILAGEYAADDPEGVRLFETVRKHASGDPDIFLFNDHSDLFINAVQRLSDIILQKSIREGFGLSITEAMWKGKAVIGGKATGIAVQIQNGKNGFLVSSPEEAARVTVRLYRNARLRAKIGEAARETVRKKFLFSRMVRDYLDLYKEALYGRK